MSFEEERGEHYREVYQRKDMDGLGNLIVFTAHHYWANYI